MARTESSNATAAAKSNARSGTSDKRVTDNVAKAAHDAVDKLAGHAGEAEGKLRQAAASGEQQLRERSSEARESTEQALDQLREYTRENPLKAAGIAFAAGMIISRLMK